MTLVRHPIRIAAAALVAALLAMATILAGDARQADAAITLPPSDAVLTVDPTSGFAGSSVLAMGSGFFPGTSVVIHFIQDPLDPVVGSTTVGSDGTFITTAAVPVDAVPGPAQFVAINDVAAAADFTVLGDEIGDTPPANVKLCEVVVILERVRNRIGSVPGSDTLTIQTNARPAGGNKDAVKAITDTFVRNEWKNVATIVGRWTQPKSSFPKKVTVLPYVEFNPPGTGGKFVGVEMKQPTVDCEDTEVVEFVEVFDADGNLVRDDSIDLGSVASNTQIGNVDLVYRIIVRELQAQ
jgi:hypothetical protein